MFALIITAATCLLVGFCAGIHVEYRNGVLDRRLCRPWPIPQPVIHEEFIDDCERFNKAMLAMPMEMRSIDQSGRLQ